MLSDDCSWYLTNGKQKVQLLRKTQGQTQNAVWTWFGHDDSEYCYRATPDIKDVPGFCIPPDSGALTGEGWQLMHEVKADPSDSNSKLAQEVAAGKTWVNYGLFQLADFEALMEHSSNLGQLMRRNKGTNHTFCDKGIYKLYVGPQHSLSETATWTHNYKDSKLLGTITMHSVEKESKAIVCLDADWSFSTITVTGSRAAYKGKPGGVVFDPKTSAVGPLLLHGSAFAITFDVGLKIEKSRIVRAADECIACFDASPCKIPDGLEPLGPCGHQDVCESCLLKMFEKRQAKCPECRAPMGGTSFKTITSIAAKKKNIKDQKDALLEQKRKIERQLLQLSKEEAVLNPLSAAHVMQIMSYGVHQKIA